MSDEWETVAVGPSAAGSSSSEWETVATGPKPWSGPTLATHPIDALTSADWWLTAPNGKRYQAADVPLDVLGKTWDSGAKLAEDVFVNAPSSIYDAITNPSLKKTEKVIDTTGNLSAGAGGWLTGAAAGGAVGGPLGAVAGGLLGGAGGDYLYNKAKQLPGMITSALGISSPLAEKISDAPTTMDQDAARYNQSLESGATNLIAAELGAKGINAASSGISSLLKGQQSGLQADLVGYNPELKAKIAKFVDEQGNLSRSPEKATDVYSKLDLKLQDLKDTGFYETLKKGDSAKSAAIKLSQFKESAGKDLGSVIDEAAKLEGDVAAKPSSALGGLSMKGLLKGKEPIVKPSAIEPDFSAARQYASEIQATGDAVGSSLVKKVDAIETAWDKSNKSVKDLKALQERYGLLHDKTFNPAKSSADTIADTLHNKLYGSLAESLKARIEGLDPKLGERFTEANKKYSAASTFEESAFNAARKGRLTSDINPLKPGGGLSAAAYFLHNLPIVGPLLLAERTLRAVKDVAPVQSLKAAAGLSDVIAKAGKISSSAARSTIPFSTKIDKAMTKAEEKLATPEAALEAPKVISAKRLPSKLTPDQAHLLVPAVIAQESGGKADAVSDVGAQGLMQLMPETGKELFKKAKLEGKYKPFDPEQNIQLGTMYLKDLLEQFDGDPALALTAYHSGPGRVKNLLKIHNADSLEQIRKYLGPVGQKYADQTLARLKKLGIESV